MAKDPYRFFRIEAAELLDQLGQGILALEKGTNPATLLFLLRLAHTLKGAARVVKQPEIADHAHSIEDILAPLRDGGRPAERPQIDALLALHDQIGSRVALLGTADAPKMPDSVSPPGAGAKPQHQAATIAEPARPVATGAVADRPDEGDMDSLLDAVTQAHRQLALLRRQLEQAQRAGGVAQALEQRLALQSGNARDNGRRALAQELTGLLAGFGQGLETALYQMDRELEQVRDSAERLRLSSAARLFMPLERAARDAAQALGKEVAFEGQGGEVRLDAEVLNLVQGALVQMVRNAVAHGIEPVAQRLAADKAAQGLVRVRVLRQGRRVAFECSDDGAGLNLEALRDKAVRKGWVNLQQASELDAQGLLQFLLRGGISTAASVNELAGRGVGLDVVRDAAERLGGSVQVQTVRGKGTTLSLTVPLRMAAMEVLNVETIGMVLAIPLDAVRQTLRLEPRDIAVSARGSTIAYRNESVPYAPLAEALRSATQAAPAASAASAKDDAAHRTSAVVVQAEGGLAALAVDRIVGTAHITLRAPPELMPVHPLLAGVSVDVEGRPQLVLDPDGLCAFARASPAKPKISEAPKLPVLVIDDSLTTRMLEQSILESAGYTVHAAVSGEEGLERARQQRYSLFLVDVEMPGMDGFTFVERTRADPVLRQVPAILITSLNSAEDKQRGADAGASGYIVKGEFAQAEFLQQVHQLVQLQETVVNG